jgi:hypothetical protein
MIKNLSDHCHRRPITNRYLCSSQAGLIGGEPELC